MRQLRSAALFTTLVFISACEPMKVEPELVLTPSPRTLDGMGQTSKIRVATFDDTGKPGTGTVQLTSAAGSLKNGADVTLVDGEASIDFACDRAEDPTCTGSVRVTAQWNDVTAGTNITITPAPTPDGGLSLMSSRTVVGVGLGQRATLTATYTVNGAPLSGQDIELTTTLGQLFLADGGAWTTTQTDTAGQVRASFVETGVAGTAVITATGPMGKLATTSIDVYLPDAGISITSDRALLTVGFDQTARITVSHNLGGVIVAGHPITLETSLGTLLELDGGALTSAATNASGEVVALLKETGTAGPAVVRATDVTFGKSATTTVNFARADAGIVVVAARSPLYLGINDSTAVTALFLTNGTPAAQQPLNVVTTLGELVNADGGAFANPATSNDNGEVPLRLLAGTVAGTATVTATDPTSGRSGSAAVAIREITTINYQDMTCNGSLCTIMGIAGSGFNTTAALRFRVSDSAGQPVANVPVTFTTETAANTITLQPSGVTDAMGMVSAQVVAGVNTGTFVVTARVLPNVSAPSPTIGVRGAKPTSSGITMTCNPVNLAAYRAPMFPLALNSSCTVNLVDRRNNPIGTGKLVEFASEAGTIAATAVATAYNPTAMTNPNEGKATTPFGTMGLQPKDTTPFAAASQYPVNRDAEPSRTVGSLVRNPRDGLVTIVAITDGEEHFTDNNNNGTWDPGEPFVDSSEPFVDTNDNDIFDGEDIPIANADVNGNGTWDGPNGTWDANTKVWTKALVLYTDAASIATTTPTSFNVPKGSQVDIDTFARDFNLNRMEGGTSLPTMRTGSRGSFTFTPVAIGGFLDGYGFDVSYTPLNAAGTGPCSGASVCVNHTRFTSWWDGYLGFFTIVGVAPSDMTPAQTTTVTVSPTTRSVALPITIGGTIQ